MIKISKLEKEALDKAGLLQYRRRTRNGGQEDANFTVVNKFHPGRCKTYYVAELPEIMSFLGHFEDINLQPIRQNQLQILIDNNIVTDKNIQHVREFKPEATVFIKENGKIYCKKITEYMITMGIWKK